MERSRKVALIAGIGLPLLMVALVFLGVYVPRLLAPAPKYDMLLVEDTYYSEGGRYEVKRGKLVRVPGKNKNYPKLVYYDIGENRRRKIEFEEAAKLSLSDDDVSPNGYELAQRDFNLFKDVFFSGDRQQYLKGHGTSYALTGMVDGWRSLELLGWVIRAKSER